MESCKLRYFNSFEFFDHTGYRVRRSSRKRVRRASSAILEYSWGRGWLCCNCDCSVGLLNANVKNWSGFETRCKRVSQKTKFSNGRFRLDTHSHDQVAVTLTIGFKSDLVLNEFKNIRLRGVALARGGFGGTGILLARKLLTFCDGACQRKKEIGQKVPPIAHLGISEAMDLRQSKAIITQNEGNCPHVVGEPLWSLGIEQIQIAKTKGYCLVVRESLSRRIFSVLLD